MVSVIMPAYRMGPFIQDALDSVAAQEHGDWEVLVVDDHAPDDGTHAIVRAFAARHADHRVELIRHETNRGVSAARNTGIAAARGEFLAFLDPDDLWSPHHLGELTRVMANGEGISVAASPVEIFQDQDGERSTTVFLVKDWMRRGFPSSLALLNWMLPSALVARKDAVTAAGGFDTAPELQHLEDFDLWVRLAIAGHRFHFHPLPTAMYRKHGGGASADRDKMFRLHLRLYAKHPEFFRRGRDGMAGFLSGELARLEEEYKAQQAAYSLACRGPLMRLLAFLDTLAGALRPAWRREPLPEDGRTIGT